jgi:hypothetical protein
MRLENQVRYMYTEDSLLVGTSNLHEVLIVGVEVGGGGRYPYGLV